MKELTRYKNDNIDFLSNVEKIVEDRINKYKPKDLFVTRIDNWFDGKWIKFSAKVMGALSVWNLTEVTVQHFHPNRVESCDFFQREGEKYKNHPLKKTLHITQWSENNLKRKIADFTDNGLLVWYSGNSKKNNKGTIMIYFVKDTDCFTYYISLTGDKDWNVHKTIGISAIEIQSILDTANTENKK